MGYPGTALVYGLLGLAVGLALALREREASAARRAALVAGGVLFWPLLAPFVLAGPAARSTAHGAVPAGDGAEARLLRIQEVQQQVLAALARPEGMAEEVLAPQ